MVFQHPVTHLVSVLCCRRHHLVRPEGLEPAVGAAVRVDLLWPDYADLGSAGVREHLSPSKLEKYARCHLKIQS